MSVTENFEYGKDNLASKYTYPSGKTTTYTYDGLMRRIKALTNTSVNIDHQYAYLASARGNTVKSTKIGWEHIGNYIYGYTYDANGNITKITRRDKTVANSAYEPQQQFAYDELNQLIRADDLAKNRTEVYTYDNGGNILSTTVYPLTWGSLSGVTATDTTTYTYGDSNWKDKLTAYGDTPITYDAIGNPLTYRGYTLTWQNGRQLASMKYGAINIGFTYDVDGLRTSKTIPNVGLEHKYYYVGNRLQYETLGGSSALWYFYDADGNPSGIRYKNGDSINDYYFVCNWRGDVIQIYNASGTLVGSYTYDAWGRVTENATSADTENITETNPIRYRGYYYDTETRLYYLKSRYYDPAVKRFLNVDGLVSTSVEDAAKNMYAYCLNNPVIYADPDGKMTVEALTYILLNMPRKIVHTSQNIVETIHNSASRYPDYAKAEEKAFTALETVGLYFADQLFDTYLPALAQSSILHKAFFDGAKHLSNSMGIASAIFLGFQVVWDYDEYGGSTKDYFLAVGIDLVGVAASLGVACLIPASTPVVIAAAVSIGAGLGIATATQGLKNKYLKKNEER